MTIAACAGGGTPAGPTSTELRVANATSEPFAFFAVAADLVPLLDPVPEISVADPATRLVNPGAEYPVGEISGRDQAPDGGVALFLYALTPDRTRARFAGLQMASGEEIRVAGGRIVVRRVGS
jgi:hypothetical protein